MNELFSPGSAYTNIYPTATGDVFVIEVTTHSQTTFAWSAIIGCMMTDSWRAKDVTIEAYWSGGWHTVAAVTNQTRGYIWSNYSGQAGNPISKLRYTLTNFASPGSGCRINSLFMIKYSSAMLGEFFLRRDGGALIGTNAAPPTISVASVDSNVDLILTPLGTGKVKTGGSEVVTLSAVQILTNKQLTNPKIEYIIDPTNGITSVQCIAVPSAVNWLQLKGTTTGLPVGIVAQGSDADVGIQLLPKASGEVSIYVATGKTPTISAQGADAAHDLNLKSKSTGKVLINGVAAVDISSSQNITNKAFSSCTISATRITPRVSTSTTATTFAINTDACDTYGITALAVDVTGITTSGTPTDNQRLWVYIVGTATRAIVFDTGYFEAGAVALPTTTSGTQRLDVGFVWNAATSRWRCMASGSA